MRRLVLVWVLLGCIAATVASAEGVQAAAPEVRSTEPADNVTHLGKLQEIRILFSDPDGDIEDVFLSVDGLEVSDLEESFVWNATTAVYTVDEVFALGHGRHEALVRVTDATGEETEMRWAFDIDLAGPVQREEGVPLKTVILVAAGVSAFLLLGIVGVVFWVRKVMGWSWRKLFVRFPVKKEVFVLYVPLVLGVALVLGGLYYHSEVRPVPLRFAAESIVVAGMFVGLLPWAADVQRGRALVRIHEREFAQLLFEMADGLRGGLDPMKALTEIASNGSGVLKGPLRVAADNIRMGRPFEEVMMNLARPSRSPLVVRYARLIGEAAKMGGEVSGVVFRAAKDMDDLVKIRADKDRKMKGPVMTFYIAYGVLMLMVMTLLDFAPAMAGIDLGSIGLEVPQDGPAAASTATGGLDVASLETRYLHLTLIMSVGTGLVIGAFGEGRLRNGLVHMLVMVGLTAVAYPLFIA